MDGRVQQPTFSSTTLSESSTKRIWERLTGPQRPRCGGGLDLIHQLEVDGHAGLEIDLEDHKRLAVI